MKQEKYSLIICEFLNERDLISVNALEKKLALPQSTFGQALSGKRLIPEKHIWNIICELANYGLKIDGYSLEYDSDGGSLFFRKTVSVKTRKKDYLVTELRWIAGSYFDLM